MEDENVTSHKKGHLRTTNQETCQKQIFAFIASTSIAHEEAHLTGVVGIP